MINEHLTQHALFGYLCRERLIKSDDITVSLSERAFPDVRDNLSLVKNLLNYLLNNPWPATLYKSSLSDKPNREKIEIKAIVLENSNNLL